MSDENAKLLAYLAAAVNRSDADGFCALITEDFEMVGAPCESAAPIRRGKAGARELFAEAQQRRALHVRVIEQRDLGNRALVLGTISWHSTEHGFTATALSCVVDFSAARVIRIRLYRDRNDAWSAAGLGRPCS